MGLQEPNMTEPTSMYAWLFGYVPLCHSNDFQKVEINAIVV